MTALASFIDVLPNNAVCSCGLGLLLQSWSPDPVATTHLSLSANSVSNAPKPLAHRDTSCYAQQHRQQQQHHLSLLALQC